MGWSSGGRVFDPVVSEILRDDFDRERTIRVLLDVLEDQDWDCQNESAHWHHPLVRKVMQAAHPKWDFADFDD